MRISRGLAVLASMLVSLAIFFAVLTFLTPAEAEALYQPPRVPGGDQTILFDFDDSPQGWTGLPYSPGCEPMVWSSGDAVDPDGHWHGVPCPGDSNGAIGYEVTRHIETLQFDFDGSGFGFGWIVYIDGIAEVEEPWCQTGTKIVDLSSYEAPYQLKIRVHAQNHGSIDNVKFINTNSLPADQAWAQCDCPVGCSNQTQNWVGGPINTHSGNYHYSQEDISIQALGGPLHLERSYNAGATGLYTDSLSPGWSHNYNMQLTIADDPGGEPNTVIVQGCRGSRFRFEDNRDGTFDPLPGVWATLTRTLSAPYTYTLTGVDQSLYLFDDDGRLVEIRDPQNQAISLEYDQDHLVRVEDSTGQRFLTFEYDGAGRLEQVSDPINRTIEYGYDVNGDLSIVTDTLGNAWTYTYSGTTHLLRDVVDPLGHVVERTEYDEDSKAVRQWTNDLADLLSIEYGVDWTATITDPLGHVSVDEYNPWGLLVGQSNAAGLGSCSHDANFNWTETTDANGNTTSYDMNSLGMPEQITDTQNNVTTMSYDSGNHLTDATDALGHTTHYEYQGNQLITVTDALSGTVVKNFDQRGLLTQVVDHGISTAYGYNDWGELTVITNALGHATTFEYDLVGRLITTSNPAGQVTVNAYDDGDNLVRVTENYLPGSPQNYQDQYNIITEYDYDAAGNQVAMTDTLGLVTRYEYDPAGRLVSTVLNYLPGQPQNYQDQYNIITEYGYDAAGNQVAMTDTVGLVTRYEYDDANRLVHSTANYSPTVGANAENVWNLHTWYEYDPAGNQTAVTDTLGFATRYEYDDLNRLIASTDPLTGTIQYGYDALGNQTVITDPTGIETSYVYDALGRVTQVEDALDQATTFTYDPAGNQETMTTADNVVTHYEYDALSRLIAVTENYSPTAGVDVALNVRTVYNYDALGHRTVITDANGHASHFVYDALGRLTSESDPLGHSAEYGYDPLGYQTVITDADGGLTTYAYDALGRLTEIQYPDSSVSYAYDPLGSRLAMTDTSGVTRYTYDPAGRPITITAPSGTVGYRYDALGRRTHLLYPDGEVVTNTYDAKGQVTQIADWDGGVTAYSYDAAGRPLETTLPNGITTTYNYDDAGRMVTLRHEGQHWTLAAYTYTLDAVGNRIAALEQVLPPTPHVYEPLLMRDYEAEEMLGGGGLLLGESGSSPSLEGGPLLSPLATPAADPLLSPLPLPGNQESSAAPPAAQAPVADLALLLMAPLGLAAFLMQKHRKRYWAGPAAFVVLAVGMIGVCLAVTSPGVDGAPATSALFSPMTEPPGGCTLPSTVDGARAVTYHYDSLGRLTEAADSDGGCYRYDYDAVGNRLVMTTTLGVHSYTYDAADRLTVADSVAYTYDDRGNLVSNSTLTYTHNTAGRMVSVAGGADLTYTYTSAALSASNADGLRVERTAGVDSTEYTWDLAADLPQVLVEGDTVYVPGVGYHDGEQWIYSLPDGLGSVRQLADARGELVQKQTYSPFGMLVDSEGDASTSQHYTGEYQEADTGLVYLRARWYDPSTGRFLSRDPFPGLAALPQTQHPYVYVGNNPINLTDPSGEYVESPWDVAMLVLDIAFLANDIHYYSAVNPCANPWERMFVLGVDAAAIGIDLASLLLPGIPGGGGVTLRLAYAGATAVARSTVHIPQAVRVGLKVAQVGVQLVRAASSNNDNSSGTNRTGRARSVNQMNSEIKRGQAPRGIEDVHTGDPGYEKPHVHFSNGAALNIDGTWKHGYAQLTRKQEAWLQRFGWSLPK